MKAISKEQNRICWFCAVVVMIIVYLAAVAFSLIEKVDPNEVGYTNPIVHIPKEITPSVYTFEIPPDVVEAIIKEYARKKTELESQVDSTYTELKEDLGKAKAAVKESQARVEEARQKMVTTPIWERLPEEDQFKEYNIYKVSLYIDYYRLARLKETVEIMMGGDISNKTDLYKHLGDYEIFIGDSESSNEKMLEAIKEWKKDPKISTFTTVVVTDINREVNLPQ